MASQLTTLLGLISLISTVYCGEITVVHAPATLRFGTASTLRATNLDDVLTASLGYTPKETSAWNGLTITSPFSLPLAAVVLEVHGGGANIRQEGATYSLKEDTTMTEVYRAVKSLVGSRAQRETLFKHLSIDDNLENDGMGNIIPTSSVLNLTMEPDATFLREMASFIKTAMTVDEMTTTNHGGQDVIFMELNSLAPLVKVYGLNSPKVNEAIAILRNQMEKVTDVMRQVYSDNVLVVTATVDRLQELSRPSRSILGDLEPDTSEPLNIATEYSTDFPVIFNIILVISIVLIVFLLGSSVAIATMDPGKDSIIYRMTNPRMKKDN